MRLTTKGRLAVVAMIDVALHHKSGPIALGVIARRQNISISYLELMFSELRRHGLVASTRGPGGGYTLGRAVEAISVADIVIAVDRSKDEAQAVEGGAAREGQRCLTPELWRSLSQRVVEFLDSVTLKSLVDEQIANGVTMDADAPKARPEPLKARVKPKRPNAPNSVFELGRFQTVGRGAA